MGYKMTALHDSSKVVNTPFPDHWNRLVEAQSSRGTKYTVCGGVTTAASEFRNIAGIHPRKGRYFKLIKGQNFQLWLHWGQVNINFWHCSDRTFNNTFSADWAEIFRKTSQCFKKCGEWRQYLVWSSGFASSSVYKILRWAVHSIPRKLQQEL